MSTPPLPSGCSNSSGVYATQVVNTNIGCLPTNAFTNAEELVGAPNASATGPGKTEFRGFVSLGINGSVTVFMGSCVEDLPGNDIRVYQSVSEEAVEVQASASEDGPFVSLGAKNCVDPPPFFVGFCEFDLSGSGLNRVRFLKIIDRETITFPNAACDNVGMSPGADVDAVQNLHPTS
ncbi:MAG TPA: hypothetical protein VLH08_02370 [Acidobacteriota bacterium]|nr:hypothetical protein [Acidobacteriota bacterium]